MAEIKKTPLDSAMIRKHWFEYRSFAIAVSSEERWTEVGLDFHMEHFIKITRGFGYEITEQGILNALCHLD